MAARLKKNKPRRSRPMAARLITVQKASDVHGSSVVLIVKSLQKYKESVTVLLINGLFGNNRLQYTLLSHLSLNSTA